MCGDGLLSSTEECDDGNVDPGDGCNEACNIENGFSCFHFTGNEAMLNASISYVSGSPSSVLNGSGTTRPATEQCAQSRCTGTF